MANNLGSNEEDPELQVCMYVYVCVYCCMYTCGWVVWTLAIGLHQIYIHIFDS